MNDEIKTNELTGTTLATPTQVAALVSPSDDGFMAAINEMDGLYAAPLAITSAPKRIWLDLGFNPYEDNVHFDNLHDLTWSQNNATGDGIEYVRSDLAARGAAQAAPVNANVQQDAERYRWLRDNQNWQVLYRIRPGKSIEYRMREDGDWWGSWWPTHEQATDAARASQEYK